MKSRFRNILSGCLLAALVGLIPNKALACAPYFQPHYRNGKSPYSTVLHPDMAIRRLIVDLNDLIPQVPPIPEGISTEEAIRQDFSEAVSRYLPKLSPEEKQKLIKEYLDFVMNARESGNPSMENFPKLPEELAEFRLYRAGVAEMKPGGTEIPPSWKKLLELPHDARHYRTLWVYFMLGNYLEGSDRGKYYQACRAAALEGFADTAGLRKKSYSNEYYFTGDQVRRILVGLEAQKNSPDLELLASNFRVIEPGSDAECLRMLEDPLCRELLAVFGCDSETFQREVWKYKFRNADILAYRAYEEGEVETAEKYLKLRTRDTLLSLYIESKIARYNGDNELAILKLRQWLKAAEKIDPNDRADIVGIKHVWCDPFNTEPSYPLQQDVYGLLGSALVLRRDFFEAAMYFYRAGQIEADVMHIAECLMSLTELTAFVDAISDEEKSKGEKDSWTSQSLRHLTARRAFREGKFDIALKYMPDAYKGALDQYLVFIRGSKDLSKSGNDRALCLYNAAKIMRWYGMELCGTQGAPDDFPYGQWGIPADLEDCPDCKYDPKTDRWTTICENHLNYKEYGIAKDDETERYYPGQTYLTPETGYSPVPRNQRFHYRYRAADLAGQAADLAQDEDLRALANLFAGECLRIRTPHKADVYYKRLVKQSPNSTIARAADIFRWFPSCPALKREMRSLRPHESLDTVKKLIETARLELEELTKQLLLRKLCAACRNNDPEAAKKYIEQGAEVDRYDEKGLVPLHHAANSMDPQMIRLLLDHGADVNKPDRQNQTALTYAANNSMIAWISGEPSPKLRETISKTIEILVENGANIDVVDKDDFAPVHYAIRDLKLLQYLADHGARFDAGVRPVLHWAIWDGVPAENIDFILKHGGEKQIDILDREGKSPLQYAILGKKLGIVKLLVENGADVNLRNEDGTTPLDLAEKEDFTEIVRYLKAHGAVGGKSSSDKTAP